MLQAILIPDENWTIFTLVQVQDALRYLDLQSKGRELDLQSSAK